MKKIFLYILRDQFHDFLTNNNNDTIIIKLTLRRPIVCLDFVSTERFIHEDGDLVCYFLQFFFI